VRLRIQKPIRELPNAGRESAVLLCRGFVVARARYSGEDSGEMKSVKVPVY
jgi:hypothetical protein